METGVDRYARYACLTPKRAENLLKKYGERPLLETVYSKPEASSYCSISMAVFLPLRMAAGARACAFRKSLLGMQLARIRAGDTL